MVIIIGRIVVSCLSRILRMHAIDLPIRITLLYFYHIPCYFYMGLIIIHYTVVVSLCIFKLASFPQSHQYPPGSERVDGVLSKLKLSNPWYTSTYTRGHYKCKSRAGPRDSCPIE